MRPYFILALVLIACSSVPADIKSDASFKDALPIEASEEPVSDDAGEEADAPVGYQACVTRWSVQTNYPRLATIYCTDSNGLTYVDGFWDSQLQLECSWKIASDLLVRCLPQNEQTASFYADGSCQVAISLAAIDKAGAPIEPFIGIDQKNDGGTFVLDYQILGSYGDQQFFFRAQDLDSGDWQCYQTYKVWPLGFRLFYLGTTQDPTIFVEQ